MTYDYRQLAVGRVILVWNSLLVFDVKDSVSMLRLIWTPERIGDP